MGKTYFTINIILMCVAAVIVAVTVKNGDIVNNLDILKSVSAYCSMMVAVFSAISGFTFSASKQSGIEGGRMAKAFYACILLVIVGMLGFLLSVLALEYSSLRPFAYGIAMAISAGTINIIVGLAIEIKR